MSMTEGEQLAKAVLFSPDYDLSEFEKDWEWEVKFSDLARAFDAAIAAERERCAAIAAAEQAEYKRQRNEHDRKLTTIYPAEVPAHVRESGWHLCGLHYASENIAALIRKRPG